MHMCTHTYIHTCTHAGMGPVLPPACGGLSTMSIDLGSHIGVPRGGFPPAQPTLMRHTGMYVYLCVCVHVHVYAACVDAPHTYVWLCICMFVHM